MFQIGDFVYLKSGGPKMVVQDLDYSVAADGSVQTCLCLWLNGSKLETAWFGEAMLTKELIDCEDCVDQCQCDIGGV